jgi:hypothetical protein
MQNEKLSNAHDDAHNFEGRLTDLDAECQSVNAAW